jgi:hypothetical protein
LHRFVKFFTFSEPTYSSEHKVKVLQVLIIPALTASFLKQETTEVVDATLVAAIVNNILDPTSSKGSLPSSAPFSTSAPSVLAPSLSTSGAPPPPTAASGAPSAAPTGLSTASGDAKGKMSRAPYDEALSIELLQLATLLVRYAPPSFLSMALTTTTTAMVCFPISMVVAAHAVLFRCAPFFFGKQIHAQRVSRAPQGTDQVCMESP